MELEQLRIFVAVAESGSFSKAASRRFVSHSSICRAVKALETELGQRLIERDNRVIGLTDAGRLLKMRAEELLHRADEIENEIRSIAESE